MASAMLEDIFKFVLVKIIVWTAIH